MGTLWQELILGMVEGRWDPAEQDTLMHELSVVTAKRSSAWKNRTHRPEEDLLAELFVPGPNGAHSVVQGVACWINKEYKKRGGNLNDSEVKSYFLRSVYQLQDKLLGGDRLLGNQHILESRARTGLELAGFRECGGGAWIRENEEGNAHPREALVEDLSAFIKHLGTWMPKGKDAGSSQPMPEPRQIAELLAYWENEHPGSAIRLGDLVNIVRAVFEILPEAATAAEDRDGDLGLQSVEKAAGGFADGKGLREEVIRILEELDSPVRFPDGPHARVFVEFFLWNISKGEKRYVIENYAADSGLSKSVIQRRIMEIKCAISDANLPSLGFSQTDVIEGFRMFEEEFLMRHLNLIARQGRNETEPDT